VDSFLVNPDIRTTKFLDKLDLNVTATSDNLNLPYENNEYDIVISSGVLEHVNEYGGDFDNSLKEIIRVLKPGGSIVIWRLPFAFSIWEYFRYALKHWYHPERYTPLQIHHLAKKYNLSVMDIGLDGVFFVSFRCYLRRFKILNKFVNWLEVRINKIALFHFLLNDIYCILKKK
jgi:predicted SAM-dependent methyltransferase